MLIPGVGVNNFCLLLPVMVVDKAWILALDIVEDGN